MRADDFDCRKCRHEGTDVCDECSIPRLEGCSCLNNPPCSFCTDNMFELAPDSGQIFLFNRGEQWHDGLKELWGSEFLWVDLYRDGHMCIVDLEGKSHRLDPVEHRNIIGHIDEMQASLVKMSVKSYQGDEHE